jgi:predicted transcriptional regulator of viral defense system
VEFVNLREQTRAADLESIGIDPEHGRVYLNRLAQKGCIHKIGRGLYKGVTTVTSVTTSDESRADVTDITNVTPLFKDDDGLGVS